MLTRSNELLKNHRAVANWLLVLATVAVFRGMLANGFVYDDGRQVLENPFVRNPRLWRHIFTGSVWSFLGAAAETNFYRPLHIFSHWLVWRLAGPDPGSFHLYQLIFYVLAGLLVFQLGRELFEDHLTAFAGALLWVLHPLHVEPVCWIAGVPDCGCGLFYLLAFLLFLRAEKTPGRRWAWHALAAGVYFPALLFKEMAVSFPLLLGVYWFVKADQASWWRRGLRWLPYAAITAVYLELRILVLGHVSHAVHLWKVTPRVAAAAVGLLGQHTRLFFWPTGLNDFRDFDLAASLGSPWPWIALLGLALAVTLRRRDPALCFLILWWPVTLLPCLDVRQLSFPLLAERFSYLPSVGLCLAVAHFLLRTVPLAVPNRRLAPLLVPVLGLALVLFTVQDLRAVPRWRDNESLWNYSYRWRHRLRSCTCTARLSSSIATTIRPAPAQNMRRRSGSTTQRWSSCLPSPTIAGLASASSPTSRGARKTPWPIFRRRSSSRPVTVRPMTSWAQSISRAATMRGPRSISSERWARTRWMWVPASFSELVG